MRKILCILLAMVMCFSSLSMVAFGSSAMDISVSNVEVNYGDTEAKVTISLANNPGIALIGFNVNYDKTAMKLTTAELGSIFTTNFQYNPDSYPFVFTVYDIADKTANGALVTLTFEINEGCEAKVYDITVDAVETFNIDEQIIDCNVTNGSVKVKAKDMTGLSFTDATYTYDGTEKSISVAGVPAGATVTYLSDDTTENKATDVGTYNITATVKKAGYNDWTATKTLKINPKNLTVTGLVAENKTYDGTNNATLSGGTLAGKINGDDVSASIPTVGTFASANVGSNIAVSVSNIALNGKDKDNYTLTQPTGLKANITKAPITIKAKDVTIKTGDNVPTFNANSYEITSGKLYGNDKLTGNITSNCKSTSTAKEYSITQGTLTAGSNYDLTFIPGNLSVVDKTPQTITVADFPTKSYGDTGFTVEVTPDETSGLNTFTYQSSDEKVATVDANGAVTIVGAGKAEISVTQAGNEDYAPITVKKELVVNPKAVTVNSINLENKTAELSGILQSDETSAVLDFSKILIEPVTEHTIIAGAGYNSDSALAKTAIDNLTVSMGRETSDVDDVDSKTMYVGIDNLDAAKTYGIKLFKDNNEITFKEGSGNTVTGKTETTVYWTFNQENAFSTNGNDIADGTYTVKVYEIVEGAYTEVDSIDIIVSGNSGSEAPMTVKATNLVLTGDKAANYTVTTEEIETEVNADMLVTVSVAAENGTVTGSGTYLKGSNITLTAVPNSGYKFSGWYVNNSSVSTENTYTFTADSDISLTAKFSKKSSGGGGGGSVATTYTVKFETNGGSEIANVKVARNKTVTEPSEPTKDGYTFDGWYTDKELKTAYDFDTKVTKSITLYAKWTERAVEPTEPTEPTKPVDSEKNVFTDVSENDWFASAVKYALDNKLMNGVSDTEFAPNDNLTRAMLVTILYRAENEPAVNKSIPFNDVDMGSYYANAVIWAKQNGIVSGYTETEFAPNDNITREQIAAIMHRYAQYKGYDVTASDETNITNYADYANISNYAQSAMLYAVSKGLINGKTDTTLNPQDNATRAEIATILQRFIESNK